MNKQELIKLAGTQIRLANLLGISQAAVSKWIDVPKARIWQLRLLRPQWFKNKK
jgi:predicted transcriptional regulator